MLFNKRGAALLQVLIVTAILAGMSAMILRLSLSRTITSRQTRRVVNAQWLIDSCMAEVNAIWAAKTPQAYARDLADCRMCMNNTKEGGSGESEVPECDTTNPQYDYARIHECVKRDLFGEDKRQVIAKIEKVSGWNASSSTPPCRITYTIVDNADSL